MRTDRGKVEMDAIRALLAGIEERTTARLDARSAGLARSGRALVVGAAAAFVLMFGVTLGAAALAVRDTRDLEAAQAAIAEANAGLEARVAERRRRWRRPMTRCSVSPISFRTTCGRRW